MQFYAPVALHFSDMTLSIRVADDMYFTNWYGNCFSKLFWPTVSRNVHITYFVVHSASSEDSQEIAYPLWNWKVHCPRLYDNYL